MFNLFKTDSPEKYEYNPYGQEEQKKSFFKNPFLIFVVVLMFGFMVVLSVVIISSIGKKKTPPVATYPIGKYVPQNNNVYPTGRSVYPSTNPQNRNVYIPPTGRSAYQNINSRNGYIYPQTSLPAKNVPFLQNRILKQDPLTQTCYTGLESVFSSMLNLLFPPFNPLNFITTNLNVSERPFFYSQFNFKGNYYIQFYNDQNGKLQRCTLYMNQVDENALKSLDKKKVQAGQYNFILYISFLNDKLRGIFATLTPDNEK